MINGGFHRNYSFVVEGLRQLVGGVNGAEFFVTTGYPTSETKPSYHSVDNSDCKTPPTFQRAANEVARRVAMFANVSLIDNEATFKDLGAMSQYLRDAVHANKEGLQIQWATYLSVLHSCEHCF